MKTNPVFVRRNIVGDHVLVPIGNANLKNNGVFPLTETGAEIFDLYASGLSESEIIEKLLTEYDVERDVLVSDVREFTEALIEIGALID